MKCLILSDLHLEFSPLELPATDADLVILAGDIGVHTQGLEWAATQFPDRPVVYVAGNHEFYGAELHGLTNGLRRRAAELGIHFLEGDELRLDGVRILGTTLWTDFRLFGPGENFGYALHEAKHGLSDFRLIRLAGRGPFRPEDSLRLHQRAAVWLAKTLAEPFDGRTVVVTHHAPSKRSIAPRFTRDILSACFASDREDLVARADLWVHGHTHDPMDYRVGNCRVVCNPRGYVRERYDGPDVENPGFDPCRVVEV